MGRGCVLCAAAVFRRLACALLAALAPRLGVAGARRVPSPAQLDTDALQDGPAIWNASSAAKGSMAALAEIRRLGGDDDDDMHVQKVAHAIQLGLEAVLAGIEPLKKAPPDIKASVKIFDERLWEVVTLMVPNGNWDNLMAAKAAWDVAFQDAPNVYFDVQKFQSEGDTEALTRAVANITLVGIKGCKVAFPDLGRFFEAIVDVIMGVGDSWKLFFEGHVEKGMAAIWKATHKACDQLLPDSVRSEDTYQKVMKSTDKVISELSRHVVEYRKAIMLAQVCYKRSIQRGKSRPKVCREGFFWDGGYRCLPKIDNGADCLKPCGGKAGDCPDFCGEGKACCRQGSNSDPEECMGAVGYVDYAFTEGSSWDYHQCVYPEQPEEDEEDEEGDEEEEEEEDDDDADVQLDMIMARMHAARHAERVASVSEAEEDGDDDAPAAIDEGLGSAMALDMSLDDLDDEHEGLEYVADDDPELFGGAFQARETPLQPRQLAPKTQPPADIADDSDDEDDEGPAAEDEGLDGVGDVSSMSLDDIPDDDEEDEELDSDELGQTHPAFSPLQVSARRAGGLAPSHRRRAAYGAHLANCNMSTVYDEKHVNGRYCLTSCPDGFMPVSASKCRTVCGKGTGKFKVNGKGICGVNPGAVVQTFTSILTSLVAGGLKLFVVITDMKEEGMNVEGMVDTISTFIDMGKPFAKPMCPMELEKKPEHESETAVLFRIEGCGDERLNGDWQKDGWRRGRPRYSKIGFENVVMEWSESRMAWRIFVDKTWFKKWGRATLYLNDENSMAFPTMGWKRVQGAEPIPSIMAFHPQ